LFGFAVRIVSFTAMQMHLLFMNKRTIYLVASSMRAGPKDCFTLTQTVTANVMFLIYYYVFLPVWNIS